MKHILLILSVFFILQSTAQITISGAKGTKITETNKDKNEVKEIKDLKFTKTIEDDEPNFIEKNTIKKSTTKLVGETVEINIIEPDNLKGKEKTQIVVDLDKAKAAIDSVKLYNNPDYIIEQNKVEAKQVIKEPKTTINAEPVNVNTAPIVTKVTGSSSNGTEPLITKTEIKAPVTKEPKKEEVLSSKDSLSDEDIAKSKAIDEQMKLQLLEIKRKRIEKEELNAAEKAKQNESSGIFFESKNEVEPVKTEPITTKPVITETKIKTNTTNVEPVVKTDAPKGNLNNLDKIEEPTSIKTSATVNNTPIADEKAGTGNPKKGSWSIGLRAGVPVVIGDIDSRAGYGFSLNIQKALGHVFALRFEALALETKGLNSKLKNNTYQNYKTIFTDYTLQGVVTLNNLNFYKKEPKVLFNIAVGAGLATRYTSTDLVDQSGMAYNYDNVSGENPADVIKSINSIRDKNYETSIPKDADKMSIKNTNILPTMMVGLGVDFKLSERFDLNIATRASYHFDDYLDGHKNGNNIDVMTFTSLGLTYKFGSKNKSLTWTNPVYSQVEEINELKKKVDEGDLLKDEDKDGIADIFDQDLNTPEKVAVDTRGIPSDMDKDGVPDYQDAEPFTPLGAQVDAKGVAIDTDNDGIADILDQEANTLAGSQVDSKGKTIIPARNTANDLAAMQSNSDFDLIFFDENSAVIKKEFYSDLYKISRYIQGTPTAKIEIIGHTDVLAGENYNLNLSERRANAVYSMLIEMFKIPSRNLTTRFEGETSPIIDGLPEKKNRKFEAAYYINRRVEFKILR